MDDEVALPDYVTRRGDIYYYVRRIPDDLQIAFGRERIQRSLRTSDKQQVRALATKINEEVERQLAEARRKLGYSVDFVDTSTWTVPDWEKVAAWFEARIIQDDLERRLPALKGGALTGSSGRPFEHWTDDKLFHEWINLQRSLIEMTVGDYARSRIERVNAVTRRIGVSMLPTSSTCLPYAAQCQRAELQALDVFFRRDQAEQVQWVHPDSIEGPWRRMSVIREVHQQSIHPISPLHVPVGLAGKTLTDCKAQWKSDREAAKKSVRDAYLREMERAIDLFEKTQEISDIGAITRRHVIGFRSHLKTSGQFEIATVNKKISFITTLLATAESHAWIDNAVKGNIHLDVPEGDDDKDPFSNEDLSRIFGHPTFTERRFYDRVKAGKELQFWLPLISCTHGLISSEIIQLGPDTIVTYPGTSIVCFSVTTAGSRHIKTLARKRFVPIREGLILDGVIRLVDEANRRGAETLWSAVDEKNGDTGLVASEFSSFWSDFLRKKLQITNARQTLYSFRHSFKNAMKRLGVPPHEQNSLMGHAEAGTGRRYGTKREPQPVNIEELNRIIQSLDWPFLERIRSG